ncbi:MAG: hypothetical protein UW86_C0001G0027 [Microgenomates group bacterium GW2011_GWA1_Microgenomates_45_10]|nr:MAG: hypothetical protein UW69_C0003G0017 [Microgenomates group bacterium GW2011_GWA2_44_7]KKT77265.1 MAG: hypothetical protein UW73_C0024G0003 [Microgenomates group bacterium GW2011_GWB1_44_8]KKT87474.1 MAG: hypothetical protein UW86_C0001G0027 [Microgenomates group bacterium GW2011_GWA1_Microgenomates_45_10]
MQENGNREEKYPTTLDGVELNSLWQVIQYLRRLEYFKFLSTDALGKIAIGWVADPERRLDGDDGSDQRKKAMALRRDSGDVCG